MRASLDERGCVAGDLSCIQCGYNLRTLHHDGKCPECGTAVERTLQGDYLRYSDPAWANKLALGTRIITWGMLILFLCLVSVWVLDTILNVVEPSRRRMVDWGVQVLGIIALLAAAASAIGLWLLTFAEPNRGKRDAEKRLRRFVRGCMIITILGPLGAMHSPAKLRISNALEIVALIAFFCCAVGTLLHVRRLSIRIPSRQDASAAMVLVFAFVIGTVVGLLGILSTFVLAGKARFDAAVFLGTLGLCIDLIVAVLVLLFLSRFRRLLAQAAKEAAETPDTTRC